MTETDRHPSDTRSRWKGPTGLIAAPTLDPGPCCPSCLGLRCTPHCTCSDTFLTTYLAGFPACLILFTACSGCYYFLR